MGTRKNRKQQRLTERNASRNGINDNGRVDKIKVAFNEHIKPNYVIYLASSGIK